jgi:hypothetical protein
VRRSRAGIVACPAGASRRTRRPRLARDDRGAWNFLPAGKGDPRPECRPGETAVCGWLFLLRRALRPLPLCTSECDLASIPAGAAQAECGETPTALDKGKRSPPSSYAPSSHGCSGGRRPFDSYPLPLGRSSQLLSPMPWSRGGGDWYRAGASVLAPVVASPPTPASLSGAAEAKRGEAGSRRGRRPPSSAAASSPAGPQAAGSLTLASHRHSSLRFVFTQ